MLTNVFFDCIKRDGIVSVASANAEGQAHIANTWNKKAEHKIYNILENTKITTSDLNLEAVISINNLF